MWPTVGPLISRLKSSKTVHLVLAIEGQRNIRCPSCFQPFPEENESQCLSISVLEDLCQGVSYIFCR